MRRLKLLLPFTTIFLIAFAAVYSGEFIHRKDFDRALMAWLRNPTFENQAALSAERRKTEMIRVTDSSLAAITTTVLAFTLYKTIKYAQKRRETNLN